MSKHFSKTEFEYPVHRICGKISRKSKVIHSCTASGKFTTYLQGERDLNAHPVTEAELDRQATFKARQALVAARVKKSASTYAADMAAYRAQYETGYKSFIKYIWAQVIEAENAD
ncbi:MAG: hypothetical protein MJZ53_03655 [Paludibacteraceae bacterium]|nr:hypothetical protein [Paludibacteraceae bacterium]